MSVREKICRLMGVCVSRIRGDEDDSSRGSGVKKRRGKRGKGGQGNMVVVY